MVKAVVGLNWGDEGKGKMVDYFAGKSDMVIRYQGSSNAGHTVINEKGKFAFHCFPSGVCFENVIDAISAGAVINLKDFREEIKIGSSQLDSFNLIISDRAILTLPYHVQLEELEEQRLKGQKFGSTLSGITPSYADKYLKKGIQVGELFFPEYLKERVKNTVEYTNLLLSGCYSAEELDDENVY